MNNHKLNTLGIEAPSILLPKAVSPKWPVIACDQYTQDRDYWEKAKAFAESDPSTLNLIFPEVFLNDDDAAERITDIHSTMNRYLREDVFAEPRQGFIYIERDTPYRQKRRGLVAAVDLEKYDWRPDARPLIRSTEGTVPERLPPRMDIRRGAPLELPHVLLLIDDDTDSLLPALGEYAKKNAPCYNTKLMMDSGSVTGWFIDTCESGQLSPAIELLTEKLDCLSLRSHDRYGSGDVHGNGPFLFAVGDGNHSLAAAKGIWEEFKVSNQTNDLRQNKEWMSHPCRYALVEIENIYDPAIQFEPIHRLIFGIGFDETISLFSKLPEFSCRSADSAKELENLVCKPAVLPPAGGEGASNCFGVVSEGKYALITTSAKGIATASLQPILDNWAGENPELIDYIHDNEEVFRLAAAHKSAGILLPPVQKSGLFETIAGLGPLPRKSFSMGHSVEKRFYLEARKIL